MTETRYRDERRADTGSLDMGAWAVRGDVHEPKSTAAAPDTGVTFAAAVTQGVVLDPSARLVNGVVAQTDRMERISDLTGVWQRHIEAASVRP